MRWWKRFREDLDRPAFQAGIEKFGTGFSHDVDRVWQLLCVEDGPGIRELPLTDETLGILARQFRVTPAQAKERLDFMCSWRLTEIKTARDGESQLISSTELKRRRDEWSKRKSRESKEKQKKQTPVSLQSDSRETPEQRQMQRQRAKAEKKTTTNAASRLVLPDFVPVETWQSFVEMRARSRKPLTDSAARLIVEKLQKLSNGRSEIAKQILEQSIERGWMSVFPLPEGHGKEDEDNVSADEFNRREYERLFGAKESDRKN